ncbi:signal peptidase II [uncultured Brevundimonas sp.]|uniref:signal peptidase II n=1 Tax=uncultured Brevundimonas sp. TaxID=213418 RepID=UPI0030EB4A1F|tara:strand:- start:39210 stop:39767 length:558 start_codon:yes stop_codon:yes gene_type:complete
MKISRLAYAAFGFALAVIVLDQLTKAWILDAMNMLTVSGQLIEREQWFFQSLPVLPPFLRFSFVLNDGVSFGLLGGGTARWLLSGFSIAVAVALGWWATRVDRRLLITAIGLVMGGAVGNVIDRIRFGGVVDFIDFSGTVIAGHRVFPWIFNIADSAISVGVVLLIVDSLLSERHPPVGEAAEKS